MTILKAENISKQYRLGSVGTGTLSHDLNRFWHQVRGKEDPYLKVGAVNDRSSKSRTDYVWALRDINFEVQQGEVLGIIGKNGAGKSTLLKILSRVTSPTTGIIKTKGRIASLLEVGTGFHPELTGRENVYLNGAILGMTRGEIEAKFDEIVEFSGCELYIDTPVKRYSSGMTVRLAFAVAAHLEPDILVVDEVLAVGDAEFQKKAIGKMQDISQGQGRTVLFVSHNMESIQQLCTRCVVLENGKTTFEGKVNEGISFYLNRRADAKSSSRFPIKEREIQVEDFYLTDSAAQKTERVLLGSPCRFALKLKNISHHKITMVVRFQIFDTQEKLLLTLNTVHQNKNRDAAPNETLYYSCLIEKMPLTAGNYTLGLKIVNLDGKLKLFEDESFFEFEVERGDFYNTGRLPNFDNAGVVLIDHQWEIKSQLE